MLPQKFSTLFLKCLGIWKAYRRNTTYVQGLFQIQINIWVFWYILYKLKALKKKKKLSDPFKTDSRSIEILKNWEYLNKFLSGCDG